MAPTVVGMCMSALLASGGSSAPPGGAGRNPLLSPWAGPYGGTPPFDAVRVEHFRPALEAAMAEQLAAVDRIAGDAAPPTFENTLAALERSHRAFDRVSAIYEVFASTRASPEFQAVEREMAPRLAAFRDRIALNEKLFARVEAVYEARERSGLTAEQRRLAWLHRTALVRAGARLDAASKERLAAINERLASLSTTFMQNVLAEEEEYVVVLESEADLDGLPPSFRAGAAAAAAARGLTGKWVVLDTRSSVEPFLASSARRDLREKVWRMFVSRGDHGDARDNKGVAASILSLRAERARLLGYPSHAHWRVEDTMAKTPERALGLLEAVWPAAVARVRQDVADMQAVADAEGAKITIAPWDYAAYAEKVRRARFDLDENEVRPYLQLEQLREGMFWVASRLFDLHFRPAKGVPVYHPDVRVWEVRDGKGKRVGLWYFDPYAREGKRSGAWMSAYRAQERLDGEITTLVSNNANFVKGAPGEPVLVSWIDAVALFHEFGHALHGLCSSVTYPSLSGTSVAVDYVEFPSQILERYLATPEVLGRFARHVRTGRRIPDALVQRIERARTFKQGFDTVEYLASAIVDLEGHLAEAVDDVAAFERDTLAALGMPREIGMRHRIAHFAHVFAGEDYSAGYWSYLWADVLSADAFEAFTEGEGPWDAKVARRLREHVFAAGNTVDPAEGYRAFRGRDAEVGALMRWRGFPAPRPAGAGGP